MTYIPKCQSCPLRPSCVMVELRRISELLLEVDYPSGIWNEMWRELARLLKTIQENDKYCEPSCPSCADGTRIAEVE